MKKLGPVLLASFIAAAGLATPTNNVQASYSGTVYSVAAPIFSKVKE